MSPEERAKRDVLALVARYYALEQSIASDPGVSLNRYYEVAAGDYAEVLLKNAQSRRVKDYRVTGQVLLGRSTVKRLDLTTSDGQLPSSTVRTCLDVRNVDVVDKEGKSVVQADRANAYSELLTLRRFKYGWRVTDGQNTETAKCAP